MAKPVYPDPRTVEFVRAFVDRSSIAGVARALRLAEATVARLAGGLPVHEGTVLVVRQRIAEGGIK